MSDGELVSFENYMREIIEQLSVVMVLSLILLDSL